MLKEQASFEVAEIDRLILRYNDLLSRVFIHEPGLIEVTAVASVLHSFYNGIERVFIITAKRLNEPIPTGAQHHRDLLLQMARPTDNRTAVISNLLLQSLLSYLAFRHFYRHSYSYALEWSKLLPLVRDLAPTWASFKAELESFLN